MSISCFQLISINTPRLWIQLIWKLFNSIFSFVMEIVCTLYDKCLIKLFIKTGSLWGFNFHEMLGLVIPFSQTKWDSKNFFIQALIKFIQIWTSLCRHLLELDYETLCIAFVSSCQIGQQYPLYYFLEELSLTYHHFRCSASGIFLGIFRLINISHKCLEYDDRLALVKIIRNVMLWSRSLFCV